jgi:hypothetical protein
MRWAISVAILFGLLATNPDEAAVKSWLAIQLRTEISKIADTTERSSLSAAFESVSSAYLPDFIDAAVGVQRRDYWLFSIYRLTPKGAAALWLELSGRETLAREGLCLIALAENFLPCNSAARDLVEGRALDHHAKSNGTP